MSMGCANGSCCVRVSKLLAPASEQTLPNTQTSGCLGNLVALVRNQRHRVALEVLRVIPPLARFCCHCSPRYGILPP